MLNFAAPQTDRALSSDWSCTTLDPELFFPEHDNVDAVRAAQRVCANCPMLLRCAELAVVSRITDGVVAGVLMPKATESVATKLTARRKLRRIANGGRVQLQRSTSQWGDPDLQKQVHSLRADGMSWERLEARLNISGETARRAFDAYNPADTDEAVA